MDFARAREQLVASLGAEIGDRRVLDAMAVVPRERFVPAELQALAYADRPLAIGHGQTISQPYIIALMTQALGLKGKEKVLEVGTGSGYQAAILAHLAERVITVERIPRLAETAGKTLRELGYNNIELHVNKDSLGWPADAPYDGIMVTAAAPQVPPELIGQMAIGGRLVIPVGSRYLQELYQVTRLGDRNLVRTLGGCRFVSLIGKGAWEPENE